MERSRLEAVVGNHCSVGYVVRIILRRIVCSIRVVVDPISTAIRRHIKLVMLVIIPWIYADVENMQEDHHALIIEMDGKLCNQVVSILIDPRSNYSYINPYLEDKCGLRK